MKDTPYRTEMIPLEAGPQGRSTMLLNQFAQDGWVLLHSHVVWSATGSDVDPKNPKRSVPALFVVLVRKAFHLLNGLSQPGNN